MLINVHLTVLTAVLWQSNAAPAKAKLCGRKLGDVMAEICHAYNSPSWDVPTVVEQQSSLARRKRQAGIADQCCTFGCTWLQLNEFCALKAVSQSPLEELEHMIADRSAEQDGDASVPLPAAVVGGARIDTREVGQRSRGYGRAGARRRRCRCRRKRRSGRRFSLMGNMELIKNVVRAAPVVGTVSPLLTWGRTLNTDFPQEQGRFVYPAVTSM